MRCVSKKQIRQWIKLINWYPKDSLEKAIVKRGFYIQRIDLAKDTDGNVNLDLYPIYIHKLPFNTKISEKLAKKFFRYFRLGINNFTNQSYFTFPPMANFIPIDKKKDKTLWFKQNPTGACLHIDLFGPEDAAVLASFANNSSWIFSTINVGDKPGGKHPVSGNRKFSYVLRDGVMVLYTMGADRRSYNINLPGVFLGGDITWTILTNNLVDFINKHDGKAVIGNPTIYREKWDDVKKHTKYR